MKIFNKKISFGDCLYVWFYRKDEVFEDEIFNDINVSIKKSLINEFLLQLSFINHLTPNAFKPLYKLDEVPPGSPFNFDKKNENFYFEFLISYKYFKIIRGQETYILVDKTKEEVIFFFNDTDLKEFTYFCLRSNSYANIFDYEMSVNIVEYFNGENPIKYKGSIVFWGNYKDKPCYIC